MVGGSRISSSADKIARAMPHGPPSQRPRRTDREQLKHDVLLGLMSGVPLAIVARRNGISQPTVDRWAQQDASFAEEIAAARAMGWDHLAVECLEIADDRSDDVVFDKDGVPHPNSANVLSRKLMVETRLRLLAKWDSGRYGDSKTVKLEGEITTTTRHVIDPASLDEAQRAALRGLIAHAQAQGLIAGPDAEAIDAEFEAPDTQS